MDRFVWICLAGAAGTGVRYLVALWATRRFGTEFPVGTVIVNVVGCFVMAAVAEAVTALSWSMTLRSTIMIGFIGGVTTYSSFNYETTRLLQNGATAAAWLNVVVTIVGAFAAGWLGMVCARAVLDAL